MACSAGGDCDRRPPEFPGGAIRNVVCGAEQSRLYESRLAGLYGAARALLLVAYTGWSKKQQLTLVL
jgi:hypothetical protein